MSDYIVVDEKLIDKLDEVKIDNGKCIMLYAKILAMANNKGYTTAGNAYFGRVLNLEDRQIRRHLNSLETAGCITRYEKRRGSHTDARMIYPKLFLTDEDDGQDCPDRTDMTYDAGHKCPEPRSKKTKTPDRFVQNPGHGCPPVKECNRYVKDNSTAGAESDASLVDVPLRYTKEFADAPKNSADAARLRLPDDLPEEFRDMKFNAKIEDKAMLNVMDIVYREHLEGKNDDWETHEDIRDNLINEFTKGFYCGDKDKVTSYAEFLMKHYEEKVPIQR